MVNVWRPYGGCNLYRGRRGGGGGKVINIDRGIENGIHTD